MTPRHHTATFALGLIVAAAGIFGIYRVLEAPKAQNRILTRPVVVALKDIPQGRSIDATTVAVARWPVGTIPIGAYSVVDSVIGRVARVNFFKGEVIVTRRVADAPVPQQPPRPPPSTNY